HGDRSRPPWRHRLRLNGRTDATAADVAVHGGRIAVAAFSTWTRRCTGFVPVQTHYVAQITEARSLRRPAGNGATPLELLPQSDATVRISRRGALAAAVAVVEVALAPERPRGSTYHSIRTR